MTADPLNLAALTDDERLKLRDEIAASLTRMHFDGQGCGTHGPLGCSHCHGPSPMTADEIGDMVSRHAAVERILAERATAAEAAVERASGLLAEWERLARDNRAAAIRDADFERDWIASDYEAKAGQLRAALDPAPASEDGDAR